MPVSPGSPPRQCLDFVVDARNTFYFQIPAIVFHADVLASLGVAELTLVTVRHLPTGRTLAAWAVGDDDEHWQTCPLPRAETVRLSLAACRHLMPYGEVRTGDRLQVSVTASRLPVWPAHIEGLLEGNEIGLHKADADALGLGRWALVNHEEVPAVCRVRLSDQSRDRGVVRISLQGRVLLGVAGGVVAHPEVQVSALPTAPGGRYLFAPEPRWVTPTGRVMLRRRLITAARALVELGAVAVLRAPAVALRTVEAGPGEDQAVTVRLPEELFPLLGTRPGKQVSVEWGPRNRSIATALSAQPREDDWPSVQMIGRRPRNVADAPVVATIHVGATTRASLGIPRVTVVTVRRRVTPLVIGRLNELIIPATGLFIGVAARVRLPAWEWLVAGLVIATLLLAPLRIRKNPRGRVP